MRGNDRTHASASTITCVTYRYIRDSTNKEIRVIYEVCRRKLHVSEYLPEVVGFLEVNIQYFRHVLRNFVKFIVDRPLVLFNI